MLILGGYMDIKNDAKNTVRTEEILKNGIRYKYEIRSFESRDVASFGIILYEIFVETKDGSHVSYYKTGGLFSDVNKAVSFLNMLKENLATPCNLPYIIEDCFSF